jgi:hypothetical protein
MSIVISLYTYLASELKLCFSNLWRTTSEEKRAEERLKEEDYNDLRKAAEVHRQVCVSPFL